MYRVLLIILVILSLSKNCIASCWTCGANCVACSTRDEAIAYVEFSYANWKPVCGWGWDDYIVPEKNIYNIMIFVYGCSDQTSLYIGCKSTPITCTSNKFYTGGIPYLKYCSDLTNNCCPSGDKADPCCNDPCCGDVCCQQNSTSEEQ